MFQRFAAAISLLSLSVTPPHTLGLAHACTTSEGCISLTTLHSWITNRYSPSNYELIHYGDAIHCRVLCGLGCCRFDLCSGGTTSPALTKCCKSTRVALVPRDSCQAGGLTRRFFRRVLRCRCSRLHVCTSAMVRACLLAVVACSTAVIARCVAASLPCCTCSTCFQCFSKANILTQMSH